MQPKFAKLFLGYCCKTQTHLFIPIYYDSKYLNCFFLTVSYYMRLFWLHNLGSMWVWNTSAFISLHMNLK